MGAESSGDDPRSDAERMLDDLFPYRRVMETHRRIDAKVCARDEKQPS